MSKIKELKNNDDHSINMVELLEISLSINKTKYVELFLNLMKKTPHLVDAKNEYIYQMKKDFNLKDTTKLNDYSPIKVIFAYNLLSTFFNTTDIRVFNKFCELNEKNLINQNDLTKYKSFDEIKNEVFIGELKETEKTLEKQVYKIYSDDTWLVIRPLTHLSSIKYGANTKWCTSMENEPSYFRKYCNKGILIYVINKKTNHKVAVFKEILGSEFSFWNTVDERIDSLMSDLPKEILDIILNEIKNNSISNYGLLSPEERKIEDSKFGVSLKGAMLSEPGINENNAMNMEERPTPMHYTYDLDTEANDPQIGIDG